MIRIFTDFQAVDSRGSFPVLMIEHEDGYEELEHHAKILGIKVGDKVILDAHEDFELTGVLNFRFVDLLGRESWVADPDWSTRMDKPHAVF